TVCLEDFRDLAHFLVRNLHDFAFLALALFRVVLGVALCGHVAAESHRDRAGGDFGESCCDDDSGALDGSCQSGGECERNRQTVSHSDNDVANDFTRGEVAFDVGSLWHMSKTYREALTRLSL